MTLEQLISAARNTKMTDAEREAQRQSFVYGNTHFENEHITRDTVDRASSSLKDTPHDEEEQHRRESAKP